LEWLRVTSHDARIINHAFEEAVGGKDGLRAAEMFWRMREVDIEPQAAAVDGKDRLDVMARAAGGYSAGRNPGSFIHGRFLLKMLGRGVNLDLEESVHLEDDLEKVRRGSLESDLAVAYTQMRACGMDVSPQDDEVARIIKFAKTDIMHLNLIHEAESTLKTYYSLARLGVKEDYPQDMRNKAQQALRIMRREGDGYYALVLLHYMRGILGAPGDGTVGEEMPPLRRFTG